ncbi:glyoxal reductase [Leptinotarsa decemlineata]|uniref:glyoxal reductase n=1 Tax=Leptinotarsa decemlineata TaxID=7539 RepID=UPI003D304C05
MFSLNFSLNFVLMSSLFLIKVSHQETVLAKYVKVELNSGDLMPLIGLGTSRLNEQELVRNSLDFALASGYRLIDSAAVYRNEELIGKALKELLPKYNLTRKDVFITTKLAPYDQGETAYMALERSLKNLNTDYVDLYLIHSPRVVGVNLSDSQISQRRDQSWQQLVRAKKNGLTKNIGVSNYDIEHLSELLKNDHAVKPAVNQVKWNPHYHQDDLLRFCQKEGILLQAYSSLGGTGDKDLLNDEEIKKIASKLGKSPAQVLLRWAFQENIAVIPKARSKEHLEQNIDLNFIIPEADMKILNSINRIPLP